MAPADGLRRTIKGLSEAEFRQRFGTEEACREALFQPGFPRWLGFRLTSCPPFGRKVRSLRGEKGLLLLSPVACDVVRSSVSA